MPSFSVILVLQFFINIFFLSFLSFLLVFLVVHLIGNYLK